MPPNGAWPDLLDLWLAYTETSQSPLQFRIWSGLSMIASCLERRVWAQSGRHITYPNLYIMLVASPGVGKRVLEDSLRILRNLKKTDSSKTKALYIASNSATRASLMDELAKARQTILPLSGAPITYYSLTVINPELQVLLPSYDGEFISRLNWIYDNPDFHSESRRTGTVREMSIENPTLNILVGTQPAYLSDTFPENAWAQGISRRLIMVYAAEGPFIPIFTESPNNDALQQEITEHLSRLTALHGLARWQPEAVDIIAAFDAEFNDWEKGNRIGKRRWPIPSHSRLVYYNRSRVMFLIKLSIICAVAARFELRITKDDVERALHYLLAAERVMPDIFREMRGKSDREIMEELHRYANALYQKEKKVRTQNLSDFLTYRLPVDRIDRLLNTVDQAGLISRIAGTQDLWMPKANYAIKGVE